MHNIPALSGLSVNLTSMLVSMVPEAADNWAQISREDPSSSEAVILATSIIASTFKHYNYNLF